MSGVLALTKLEHFIGTSTSILLDVFTITLFTGWIVYFIVKCWRLYKEYRTCKQTPVLHPLYSDVQHISKQRKLYNLKTHLTKYILMVVCCLVEVGYILGIGCFFLLEEKLRPLTNNTHFVLGYLNCTAVYFGWFAIYDEYSFYLPIQLSVPLLISLHLTLIAFLSRYLATRYLNHPFKRTIIKYLIWCSIQCILIGFCSTKYTWIFIVLILPIISLINWILLLRATSFLSRVLRSHLIDIRLYSNNKVFYNTQLSAFKFYRIFRIVLLTSTCLLILVQVQFFVWRVLKIFFFNDCQIQIAQRTIIPSLPPNNRELTRHIMFFLDDLCFIVYTLSLLLPLCGVTFAPFIIKCVKRCREKEDQYRYNYDKLEPLLRRHH